MMIATAIADVWLLGSLVVFVIYWIKGVVATLSLGTAEKRLHKAGALASYPKTRVRGIVQDKYHPLYHQTRRLRLAQRGLIRTWFSGLAAGLIMALITTHHH